MAQLKNTVISGSLRATDTISAQTAQFKILNAPTTSNGTTYGPGTNGNFLRSNGTSAYWVSLAATDIPTISITDKTSGTLTVPRGGTGATTVEGARTSLGLGTMATETAADYLKLSGGRLTGDTTLYTSGTGDTPSLIFQREDTIGGGYYDWRILNTGGKLTFQDTGSHTSNAWTTRIEFYTDTLTAPKFSGNGASLTSLNGSNISSGTVAFARLPTGTGANQVAVGNHTHSGTYVPNTTGANDVNTIVNTGIYNITSGSATNTPKGYGYGQLLVMSYRKHTGNTTTDWASQIYLHNGEGTESGSATAPGNVLYYRTSNSSSSNTWFTWRKAVHVAAAYTKVGGSTTPVYIAESGEATACSAYAGGTAVTLNNSSKAASTASFYAPTAGGTADTQALVGNGATSVPKWVDISPSITIGAGTGSAAPTVNVTVLGQSGTAQSITTASTSVYGVTKLNDGIASNSTALAATANSALVAAKKVASSNSTSKLYLVGATSQSTTGVDSYSYQYTYTNNGLLSALKVGLNLNGTEKAHMEWNNDDQTIDFVFA